MRLASNINHLLLFDAMEQHFLPSLRPNWVNGFAISGHAFII
jgi:hypothetical protein